jgi:hypothetical protein
MEYVIWGIPPQQTEEQLLIEKLEGQYITCHETAKRVADALRNNHNCTGVRIQSIDLSHNFSAGKLFTKAIN